MTPHDPGAPTTDGEAPTPPDPAEAAAPEPLDDAALDEILADAEADILAMLKRRTPDPRAMLPQAIRDELFPAPGTTGERS